MRALIGTMTLAAAIALVGCNYGGSVPPPASISATVVLEGTRAFIIAEYAYEAAAESTLTLVRAGAIKGEKATQLRAINARAIAALKDGKASRDAAARAVQARTLFELVDQLNALVTG